MTAGSRPPTPRRPFPHLRERTLDFGSSDWTGGHIVIGQFPILYIFILGLYRKQWHTSMFAVVYLRRFSEKFL